MKKKIGIIGASGFTGVELIKILVRHKKVDIKVLNSRQNKGIKISDFIPGIITNLRFTSFTVEEINKMELDILFLCMPNGEAMKFTDKIKRRIIDLSADYRFDDHKLFEEVYGIKHLDIKKAVYGLPELFRKKIKKADLVANPGCYATASILGSYPIKQHAKYIIFDCKSGYSGSGKDSEYIKNPSMIKDNIIPYKLTNHRHKYEISQFIDVELSFTPQVIDTFQGILVICHILLKNNMPIEDIKKIYKDCYRNENFVKVVDFIPSLHDVQKTNYCIIGGFEVDENNQLVIISVLDNLIKGAAGQAVQNMNLMLGFDEKEGLIELI